MTRRQARPASARATQRTLADTNSRADPHYRLSSAPYVNTPLPAAAALVILAPFGARIRAMAVNLTAQLNDQISFGVQYALREDSFFNLGIHAVLGAGPFQFYFLTDNVLGLITPADSRSTNARLGFNLVF